jgi:DinB superfamily
MTAPGGGGRAGAEFATLFDRELGRVAREVEAYREESNLWLTPGGTRNPPGTLVLHIAGNLQAYIGAGLGDSGYRRDREAEFSRRDVARAELLREIAACRETLGRVLPQIDDSVMEGVYPGTPPERLAGIGTRAFLVHLTWHLGWHLGQIYYHRLIVEGDVPG